MFGGLNLKSLSDRLNESLHDLENTIAQGLPSTSAAADPTSPPRQQPTRTSSSPAASPSSARTRPSLDSIATRAQSVAGGLGNLSSPLSPTTLANAQQSASQLAEGALSSLRASLRKGRQSLDTVARASLDGGSSSSNRGRPAAALASPSKREGSIKEEELIDIKKEEDAPEEKKPKLEEQLVDIGDTVPTPTPPANPDAPLVDLSEPPASIESTAPPPASASLAPSDRPSPLDRRPSSLLDPPTPEEGEDEDAWGVGSVGIRTPAIPQGETPAQEEVKGEEAEPKVEDKGAKEVTELPPPKVDEEFDGSPAAPSTEPEIVPLQDSTSASQTTAAAPVEPVSTTVDNTAPPSAEPNADVAKQKQVAVSAADISPEEITRTTEDSTAAPAGADESSSLPTNELAQASESAANEPEPAVPPSPPAAEQPKPTEPAPSAAHAVDPVILNGTIVDSSANAEPAIGPLSTGPAPSSASTSTPEIPAAGPEHNEAANLDEELAALPAQGDVEEQQSSVLGAEEKEEEVEAVQAKVEDAPAAKVEVDELEASVKAALAAPAPADEPAPPAVPAKPSPDDHFAGLKASLDKVVASLTPLGSVDDVQAFEDELRNMRSKAEMAVKEVARLTGQKESFDELRETHRLEHKSQQEEIDSLREQLATKDSNLSAAESAAAQTRAEITRASEEYDKLKIVAKEEEEKRIKALSLLRALRQKLVKNEKEKEDSDKELERLRASEQQAQETLRADRSRFDSEIVALRSAQEQQINKLKQSFERETAKLKEQFDRDSTNKRGQFELDAITAKAQQAKELATKDARIKQLETTVRELSTARDSIFDQLQLRQAEIESSETNQEALKTRAAELEYELREAKDRIAAMQDELDSVRRHRQDSARDEGTTRRLLEEAEARHAVKVCDLEARAAQLEKDRRETEDEMGRNLQERLKEVERLRAALAQKDVDFAESVQNRQKREKEIEEAQKARADLEARLKKVEAALDRVREESVTLQQGEAAAKEELNDRLQRMSELEARLEEAQTRESNLRSINKTLREELRKLQSGVLLAEKQRHPGVGYFSSFSQQSVPSVASRPAAGASTTSLASTIGGPASPPLTASSPPASISSGLAGGAKANGDEALNFEYIRNILLQFLEKPEMRPHLVQVLGVILHFTPAELRRLAAKAATPH
ncbi:viral A-type inclusion protein repeat containing protein [Rhodotorula toruloides]|uniref:Viral A-type inclusion protein repeat containing protein n=1 Tax=Rhodotorula toruloides TaxID=5286 RepID=A0A511KGI8_RHOTO|nr:viral A-type inclusion protein repeat containing protein [Rhodotorula toruloides]